MPECRSCPRDCNTIRPHGFCGMPETIMIARAAPHFGEEPCISGTNGSGTIFFTGCNLRCLYCQNYSVSHEQLGYTVTSEELRTVCLDLIGQGVHNINLVTPSHYISAIDTVIGTGLPVPVIWNSSGYDSVHSLKMLRGKIQIYMPDMKYSSDFLGKIYSSVSDYVSAAGKAVLEMYHQVGRYKLDRYGIMQSGVLIRHLILPGQLQNTFGVIDWLRDTFPRGSVLFSLMGQYTPVEGISNRAPELDRKVTSEEYAEAVAYLESAGIEDGYLQEPDASGTEYIPEFYNQ
ncbi:MAG: radical SAM protein [Eubacteriales bacterium]